jgi:putative hydrolase of HD superfamily
MERKGPDGEHALFPSSPETGAAAEKLLRTYLRTTALKNLYRQGWLKRGIPPARCESVADHSFGTAILVLLLAGKPPFAQVDADRCLRMAVVHELGEVYAGDITPVDGISAEEKHRMERESLDRVLAGLPGAGDLIELWEDFEEGASPEARFLKKIDRLEMGIQAALYRSEGFSRMEEFIASAEKTVGGDMLGDLLRLADTAR